MTYRYTLRIMIQFAYLKFIHNVIILQGKAKHIHLALVFLQ